MIVMIAVDPYNAGLLGCTVGMLTLVACGVVMLLEWTIET